MNLSRNFPELNHGQLKMLERYVNERQKEAIEDYKRSRKSTTKQKSTA